MKIFKKEHEVADLALEYLETATQCVASGKEAVLAYLGGEMDSASTAQRAAAELETAADTERRTIGDLLFSGAYLPLIRGDIFSVIEQLDKVPNSAESCSRFFLGEKPEVPNAFHQQFLDVADLSFRAMDPLRKAVKGFFKPQGDIERIRANAQEVGILESRVDDLEWQLTVAIFESSEIDLCRKRHLKAALGHIVHLSDVAENVADRLELAAMKSVL